MNTLLSLPPQVTAIMNVFADAGKDCFVVGGAVRDGLLQRPIYDYDLTTEATPEEMLSLFDHAIPTGIVHGTVTVVMDGMPVEVTTYRTEGTYSDGRHPDRVAFTNNLVEDLARRDFTVNAMAYHPDKGLIDPYGGQNDLNKGILRCVGKPGLAGESVRRFQEDALRILRCIRFAAQLGFMVEEETKAALLQEKSGLSRISAERITSELDKLLLAPYAVPVLLSYRDVIGVVIPELIPCFDFDQHTSYHAYDVYEHCVRAVGNARLSPQTLAACEMAGGDSSVKGGQEMAPASHEKKAFDPKAALRQLKWAALLHDIEKPACFFTDEEGNCHFYGHSKLGAKTADDILLRLKFDTASREKIVFLIANHDRQFVLSEKPIKRAIRKFGREDLLLLMDLYTADCLSQSELAKGRVMGHEIMRRAVMALTTEAHGAFSRKDLAIDGNDVAKLGYKGPAIGKALEQVLDAVIDGQVANEREALLAYLEKGGIRP